VIPAVAEPALVADPALRAPPADPRFGVVIGEVRPPVEQGMLVLAADLVPTFERAGCGDFIAEIRGGAFRCDETPLGLYTAFVRGDGTEWARQPIYIESGELVDLGVLELVALPPESRIRGTVRDVDGQPLEGVCVGYSICTSPSGFDFSSTWSWTTETDRAGEFSLAPTERQVSLEFSLDGYRAVGPWHGLAADWGDDVHVEMAKD
jgi:hypothetical protein